MGYGFRVGSKAEVERRAQVARQQADIFRDEAAAAMAESKDGISALYSLKFGATRRADGKRHDVDSFLLRVESVFTILVALQATLYVWEQYPDTESFNVQLATTLGYVKSSDKRAYAEVFAAGDNASELRIIQAGKRASEAKAENLYVCYHSPGNIGKTEKKTYGGREVTVVCLPVLDSEPVAGEGS